MSEQNLQLARDPTLELIPENLIPIEVAMDGINLTLGLATSPSSVQADPYEGPCIVTPSQTAQTLSTRGKMMGDNVTVEPIPSNYGLITWNGSVLTVS